MGVIRMGLLAAWVMAAGAAPAWACAVCQGNPDSNLVKGAQSGVILLVAVTYFVVLSFCGLGVMWFVRARRLSVDGRADDPRQSPS